ncbi:MAG: hypothetical protein IKS48_07705 [Eubacterium sp.]|nr:hypothetical protein [Eubacterium sp.]
MISLISIISGLFLLSGCGKYESTFKSYDLVVAKVNAEMANGTDGYITINIGKDVSEEDLSNINYSIDTMQGNVTSITTYKKSALSDSRKVKLTIERADAMYVYDHILDGKEIPPDKTKAKELSEVCEKILKNLIKSGMSDYEKELAIHDYIVDNCSYGLSKEKDDSEYSAYGVLINHKAVCSGYASAMNLLLNCAGVDSEVISGKAFSLNSSDKKIENHAWNLVRIDGEWYHLDATWDDPVGESDALSHEFFNIPDSIMKKTHTWDVSKYRKCSHMEYNYYKYKGAYISDLTSLENYLKVQIMNGQDKVDCVLNNLDIDENDLMFLYGIDRVKTVGYSMSDQSEYRILVVYINRPQ